ncbi:MAG TPA: HmuY family protein [Polyangiaceae bacterium]|nr:HmuY family protein [Polyangiaceae bacterium]
MSRSPFSLVMAAGPVTAAALLLTLFLPLACAERLVARDADLELEEDDGGAAPRDLPAQSGKFRHTALGDGTVISTIVDATDTEAWQKLDLDSGYADTDGWDLAFRRFGVLTNGGITGGGGVQALALPAADFDALTRAPEPSAAWSVDVADGDDDDTLSDNAFSDWYDYDVATHELTPKDIVFVVRSSEARYYKLRFEGYYDEVGTSGVVTFRWAELEPPEQELPPTDVEPDPDGGLDGDDGASDGDDGAVPESSFLVDARSYDDWAYVKIGSGVVSGVAQNSGDWDLAIQRFVFRSNGGTSGPGLAAVKRDVSGSSYDALNGTSADGFVVDAELEIEGPSGATTLSSSPPLEDWYDYQPDHTLLPYDYVYVVRGADGVTYAKLRILQYVSGQLRISLDPIPVTPTESP